MIALAAGSAAMIQAVAYVVYLVGAFRRSIQPNPTSWLMWAYGTGLVVVLEADQSIDPLLRLLPTVCALSSVAVALLCLHRGARLWPRKELDRYVLLTDLMLTAVYVVVTVAAWRGSLPEAGAWGWKSGLLVAAGASTALSYLPTVAAVLQDPRVEDWRPWGIWTLAYALLLAATVAAEGTSVQALQFHVYPAVCLLLSAAVTWCAIRSTVDLSVPHPSPLRVVPAPADPHIHPEGDVQRHRRLHPLHHHPSERLHPVLVHLEEEFIVDLEKEAGRLPAIPPSAGG